MRNLLKFDTTSSYEYYIGSSNFVTPNISLIEGCTLQFHPYIPPKAKLLDILYSDINGNLSFTSKVLPVSEGKTPIGLCVAEQGFFGIDEPARWISLKYMNCTTPDTGSLTAEKIQWGYLNYSNKTIGQPIKNKCKTKPDGNFLPVNWITPEEYLNNYGINVNTDSEYFYPSLFNENNNWNLSELGEVNEYVITDINGKNNTNLMLQTVTNQPTWQTDNSIYNLNPGIGYAPIACCCARYHTLGTQSGNWYLGATGEMSMFAYLTPDINNKLSAISKLYPNDCINILSDNGYMTSTEINSVKIYTIYIHSANVYGDTKDVNSGNPKHIGIAMLQY